MQLVRNFKGISKLAFLLLLIVFFLMGGVFSYVWTMGSYAPSELNLPSQANATIENVHFPSENATYFNVTLLNPSYSRSDAVIDKIRVVTSDGEIFSTTSTSTSPRLPVTLSPGKSQVIQCFLSWGRYAGQNAEVYVIVVGGSGSAVQAATSFMNLTVTSVTFEPSVASGRFNVTVESEGSPVSVDLSEITVNGAPITDLTPALPYKLDPNNTVVLTLNRDWSDLQNKTVSVIVRTQQGYEASKTVTAPQAALNVSNFRFFNTTATDLYFNVTIQNSAVSPARVDVNLVTVYVEGQNITIQTVTPTLPQALQPNSALLLTCTWDWGQFKGKNATVTIYTVQGFKSSTEKTISDTP